MSAFQALDAYQTSFEARLRDTARALALAVDGDFQSLEAAANAIAALPALRTAADEDVAALRAWASEVGKSVGALRVIINDAAPGHRQLMNTGVVNVADLPLPSRPGEGAWDVIRRVVETNQPAVSNLFLARAIDRQIVAVAAPVANEGQVTRAVLLSVLPDRFSNLLAAQGLTGSAIAGLADANGRLVARSRDHAAFVGRPAPDWYSAITNADEGIYQGRNAEGEPTLFGFRRLRVASGWGVVVGEPIAAYNAVRQRPLQALLFGATVILGLATATAVFLARRMLAPLRALQVQADLVAAGGRQELHSWSTPQSTSVAEFEALRSSVQRADAALRAGEEEFRTTFEQAPIAMAQSDPATGRLLRVNAAYCALTGRQPSELVGAAFSDAVHPDDRAVDLASWQRMAAGEIPVHEIEKRYVRPDGSIRWARASVSPIRDLASGRIRRTLGALQDVTDQKAAHELQRLLTREVDHRAKNALAVVSAVLRLTPRDDPESYAQAVEGRVNALARAHTMLAAANWRGVDLQSAAEAELVALLGSTSTGEIEPRVKLGGPALTLSPGATQAMLLVLHELTTNAIQHGSLSTEQGRVKLSWTEDADSQLVRLTWSEVDGPFVSEPSEYEGFGSRLLELSICSQLNGRVTNSWRASGLVCDIELPRDTFLPVGA